MTIPCVAKVEGPDSFRSMEKSGNGFPSADASSLRVENISPSHVKALVVGAGPVGLFACRQLDGMDLYHDESVCEHQARTGFFHRKVLVYDTLPSDQHHESRAKMCSGKKLASFYNKNKEGYEPCLKNCFNNDRKVDWALCSDQPPGGSWNSYLPSQQTVIDYRTMGLPDHPIEECDVESVERIAQPPAPAPCERVVTNAKSLVNYYGCYSEKLPKDRMCAGKVVSVFQKGSFWEVTIQGLRGIHLIRCDYLLLAIGKTETNWLNILGEKENPHVSHSTREACEAMTQLNSGANILVVGDGLSACDTIWEAWNKGLKVTHLLSSKVIREAEKAKSNPKNTSHGLICRLYNKKSKRHHYVAHAIAFPEKYRESYEQGVDFRLAEIINERECLVVRQEGSIPHKCKRFFDHIALLTGTRADFSFFHNNFVPSLFRGDGNLDLCPETMEANNQENLFLIGSGANESFQRDALGHAVAATETIKRREKDKLEQERKRVDQVEEMDWE